MQVVYVNYILCLNLVYANEGALEVEKYTPTTGSWSTVHYDSKVLIDGSSGTATPFIGQISCEKRI